jgi:dihydrofolate reductase
VANSLQDVINYCRDEREIFIIGGAEIFNQAMPMADEILLTRVHTNIEGADAFFPELPESDWELISQEKHNKDDKHQYDYTFEVYKRK